MFPLYNIEINNTFSSYFYKNYNFVKKKLKMHLL